MSFHVDFDEFYADKINSFEQERKIFADYRALIVPEKMEIHELDWENKKLEHDMLDTKHEAEYIAGDLNKLKAEVDSVRRELSEQRIAQEIRQQQIMRLSNLAYPVEKDITYLIEDRFPQKHNNRKQSAPEKNVNFKVKVSQIYKPVKTGEVLQLERRLDEETAKSYLELQSLKLRLREAEEERYTFRMIHREEGDNEITLAEKLREEADHYDMQCYLSVSDLLKLRFGVLVAQREEIEDIEKLQKERDIFEEKEKRSKDRLIADLSLLRRTSSDQLQENTRDFHRQLVELELKRKRLKIEERGILENKFSLADEETKYEKAAKFAKKRFLKLKRRYYLEMEGYQNEVMQLKRKLKGLEKLYSTQEGKTKKYHKHEKKLYY